MTALAMIIFLLLAAFLVWALHQDSKPHKGVRP